MAKNAKLYGFLLAALSLLGGCSGLGILDALVPSSGYTVHKNIAYGDHARQSLDIYVPDNLQAKAPVVVFFYGGSWKMGSKDQYRFIGQAFASKGYVTVVADYRLYPEVYFPAFVEDGADAVVFVHKHIAQYGGDPANVFLTGHSAGGFIAAMLTVNDRYIKAAGGKRSWIRGMIGIAAPYDFLPFSEGDVKKIFSKEKDISTQPITFVGPHTPPMLLLTGDEDEDVLPRNAINLAAKLRKFGNPVTERIYPGVAHIAIVLALADGFRHKAPTLEDIDHFIRFHSVK